MRRLSLLLVVIAATLLAPAPARALPRVTSSTVPAVIHVGDTVTVEARIDGPVDLLPVQPPAKLGAFDLIGVDMGDSAASPRVVRIHLTSFEIGPQEMPRIGLAVREGGRIDSVFTGRYLVTVASLLPADSAAVDTLQPLPAKGPMDIPRVFQWRVLIGYLAALGALAALGWWLYRRYKNRPRPVPTLVPLAEPAVPAHVLALRALDEVAAKGYVARGLLKAHYSEALDVLRTFLERRTGVEAMDRTTFELLGELRRTSLSAALRDRLAALLEEGDLVKFAKQVPPEDAANALVPAAREWVESVHGELSLREAAVAASASAAPGEPAAPAGEGAA
jgi:hypothetical protein